MIWTNILQGKKYKVVQTVSPISRDFLFLAINLNCSDRFPSKTDTEGNTRKSTVNFAISGYADVIKYQEKPTFSCVSARRLLKLASSARALSYNCREPP